MTYGEHIRAGINIFVNSCIYTKQNDKNQESIILNYIIIFERKRLKTKQKTKQNKLKFCQCGGDNIFNARRKLIHFSFSSCLTYIVWLNPRPMVVADL